MLTFSIRINFDWSFRSSWLNNSTISLFSCSCCMAFHPLQFNTDVLYQFHFINLHSVADFLTRIVSIVYVFLRVCLKNCERMSRSRRSSGDTRFKKSPFARSSRWLYLFRYIIYVKYLVREKMLALKCFCTTSLCKKLLALPCMFLPIKSPCFCDCCWTLWPLLVQTLQLLALCSGEYISRPVI